jgi:23S rRNA (cytosine1962-C5)-methyltransferase
MLSIYLKAGRERPVLNGHPWIFSGAVERVEGGGRTTELVDVYDHKKTWLARGFYNPKSQIRARLLTWRKEDIDGEFFSRRLAHALAFRGAHLPPSTTAYRIINGEGDFLPGVTVDRYGGFLVCQIFSAGMALFKNDIVDYLSRIDSIEGVFERSEGRIGDEEGTYFAVWAPNARARV